MTPERVEELAKFVDPDDLWRTQWDIKKHLTPEAVAMLDAGVALRRYASHLRRLEEASKQKKSVLITPFSESHLAVRIMETPYRHEKLRPT